MDRRGFIGSVIGLAAGSRLIALAPPHPRLPLPPLSDQEFMSLSFVKLQGLVGSIEVAESEVPILAPSGMSVAKLSSPGRAEYVFKFPDIEAVTTFTAVRCFLRTPNGRLVRESTFFREPVRLFNGDTLKVAFTVILEGLPVRAARV